MHLGGRVAFRSYLKNHFGLGKDEVAAADRDVGGIIDESNATIRQNFIGLLPIYGIWFLMKVNRTAISGRCFLLRLVGNSWRCLRRIVKCRR